MTDESILRNKILDNVYEVYACNPETFQMVIAKRADLPFNWIVYPNEFCPKNEFHQADLTDEDLKEFLFKEVLPKSAYVIGEKRT